MKCSYLQSGSRNDNGQEQKEGGQEDPMEREEEGEGLEGAVGWKHKGLEHFWLVHDSTLLLRML